MIKHCEFCGKEFEVPDNVHGRKKRFCNTSCSAKWRIKTYGKAQISEAGRQKQSDSLKRLWRTKKFRDNNHKRMITNNPVYMPGVVEKANKTRLQRGKLPNNFKYGNGRISEYEAIVYDDLINAGFYYNYAIPAKLARDAFPDKKYPSNYKPDFTNVFKHICIEIDGPNHKRAKELDTKKDECLKFLGFTIIRFTHEQIDKGEFKEWLNSFQNES